MSDIEIDEQEEIKYTFAKAADYLQRIHTELSSQDLLHFYALYKQATCGPCNISKPSILNFRAKSKWSAWNELGKLNQLTAMEYYVNRVAELDPKWNEGHKNQWVCQSIHKVEHEAVIEEVDKTAFDYVKEPNFIKLKATLPSDLSTLDSSGMGLIHWAADRNTVDILEHLLSVGADVDLQDCDGQTALHYASACGHLDCIKVLMKFGADRTVVDNDGSSCLDVAFDESVVNLLRN